MTEGEVMETETCCSIFYKLMTNRDFLLLNLNRNLRRAVTLTF